MRQWDTWRCAIGKAAISGRTTIVHYRYWTSRICIRSVTILHGSTTACVSACACAAAAAASGNWVADWFDAPLVVSRKIAVRLVDYRDAKMVLGSILLNPSIGRSIVHVYKSVSARTLRILVVHELAKVDHAKLL